MKIRNSLSQAVVCLHIFPQKRRKKKKLLRTEFLSEPLFEGLGNRNALGSQGGNFKRNPAEMQ